MCSSDLHHHKEIMVELETVEMEHLGQVVVEEEQVVLVVELLTQIMEELVETEQHLLFLEHQQLMQVVGEVLPT